MRDFGVAPFRYNGDVLDTDHLHTVLSATAALATDGVEGLDGVAAREVALAARRLRELAAHLEVHALGVLDESGDTDRVEGMCAAGWFSREAGLPTAVGRSQVKLSRTLRHLEATDQAWLDGRITRDHVRVIADAANPRIRDQIAAAQDDLIALAEGRTFRHWRDAVVHIAEQLDEDGPNPDDPDHTTASWSRTGLFAVLKSRFAGADVETLEQIIEAKTDDLFRRQTTDREQTTDIAARTRSQLRGLAIAELLLEGHAAAHPAGTPKANISLVLRYRDAIDGQRQLGWPTPPPPAAPASLTDATWTLTNLAGQHLEMVHFATLLCDCAAHAFLVDDDGNPLKLGMTVRFATPKQRRAVLIRDGGCTFPGCDRPVGWLDIHHVLEFERGGHTDIENLAALCRSHHGVTHRNGWTMTATTDGWFWWCSPSGHTFRSQRHGQQRAGPAPPGFGTAVAA